MPSLRAPRSIALAAVLSAGLLACQPAPITLKLIGVACTADGDCGSGLCSKADKVCTRSCGKQLDCPVSFDCGLAHLVDGQPGGLGATCYKANYVNPTTGGFGTSCAAYSTDADAPDAHCDATAANPCGDGFTCLAALKCDPDAICSKECTADSECPPQFFCAVDTGATQRGSLGRACAADADCTGGQTCQAVGGGGTAKVCAGPKKWCRPRTQCSPCGPVDQCPLGYTCATDASGERFCGKTCSKDEECPWPVSGTSNFMQCIDGKNGVGNVCRPLQGSCHGVSNLPDTAPGGQCSWCRPGIPSDCPGSFCLTLQTLENTCVQTCTIELKKNGTSYAKVMGSDKGCGTDQPCVVTAVPAGCGAGCTAGGVCAVDSSGMSLTCFP